MQKDNPDLYTELYEPKPVEVDALAADVTDKLKVSEISESDAAAAEEAEKKHQSRGGKGLVRDESVKLDKEALKRAVGLSLWF